jgi:hypothetical protein
MTAAPESSSSQVPAAETLTAPAAPDNLTDTIDLATRSDLNLVHRAVRNGWPLSERVRDQVRTQLPALVKAAETRDSRFRKLEALAVAMDMRHLIDSSSQPVPCPSKRNPGVT